MVYNGEAQQLGIKVIGTVESNLDYTAINYNDPITVGVGQWYGTRAAAILERMRTTRAELWYDVQPSIANQLASISQHDSYWNSRYLTRAEGDSLRGVLSRNQEIQNTQMVEDMEGYKTVAISYGFDPDANTKTVLYFFAMHHQSPASALEVVQTLDTAATLDQIHAATMAHPILGQYGSRYRTVFNLITEGDITGTTPGPQQPLDPANGNTKLVSMVGDMVIVKFVNGEDLTCYPDGRGNWIPRKPATPDTPTQPAPPPGTGTWTHPLGTGAAISSNYGPRSFDGYHFGVDFTNGGANVVAPCDLKITVARENGTGGIASAGTYVKGHTLDNAYTFGFYHMVAGSMAVAVGQTVTTGTVLGVEGATGNVTGRHLHFEAYAGTPADPWPPPYGEPIEPLQILRNHGVNV